VRVLAVDPGQKHLGLAISDPTGTLARPLATLRHVSRTADAQRIADTAAAEAAELVLIGYPLDSEGLPGLAARQAENLAEALRQATALPVLLFDESFSSQAAEEALRQVGKKRRDRREQVHAVAAASILQSYLDGHPRQNPPK
jgi:putative Holliday junction resolvase